MLGLRLVKRTVNFDDPGTYHFYFGDESGTPGTILTFFPWPGARRGQRGVGQIAATAFAIAPGSIGYWLDRFKQLHVTAEKTASRFGEEVIRFTDPDGLMIELVGSEPAGNADSPATGGLLAAHSLRGFHSVSAAVRSSEPTANLLTQTFGYRLTQEFENRLRFVSAGDGSRGGIIDLLCPPDGHPGAIAVGSVHHVAFRAKDDAEQLQWRELLVGLGYNVTPVMDRTYFHSIYFREPGGILFEIATESPGFTVDEAFEELGSKLCLPPWMEPGRAEIERILPPVRIPTLNATK